MNRPNGAARIVLLPPDVQLFELSAGGISEPKEDWSASAREHMTAALRQVERERNLRLINREDDQSTEEQVQVARLFRATASTIAQHHYVPAEQLPTKQGRIRWSIGSEAGLLRREETADYALMILLQDSFASAGRAAVIFLSAVLFGVQVEGGVQMGVAALVDLRTGEIVWYNRLARSAGDSRTAEGALETVRVLLTGLPQ
ncbi:MAG: hypothetical protein SF002_17010 [Alphaproteobacteria bacterium]|nr:hypothetical protein [Alphaproteobacteria bacterium]